MLAGGEGELNLSLFPIGHREVVVHRKAPIGLAHLFQVIGHVVHAPLFVGAKDQADIIFQRDLFFLEEGQRIEGGHQRSFVVHNAPAYNVITLNSAAEGRIEIVLVGGNHIGMGCDHQTAALGRLRRADLQASVIVIDGIQSLFPAEPGAEIQGPGTLGTIGIAFGPKLGHAGDLHKFAKIFDDFFFVRRQIIVNFLFPVHFPLHENNKFCRIALIHLYQVDNPFGCLYDKRENKSE